MQSSFAKVKCCHLRSIEFYCWLDDVQTLEVKKPGSILSNFTQV